MIKQENVDSENDSLSSSKIPQLIPVSGCTSFHFTQTSELYKHYMITIIGTGSHKPGIEVLNLETGVLERVALSGNSKYLDRHDHCTCKKGENEIILYGGYRNYKPNQKRKKSYSDSDEEDEEEEDEDEVDFEHIVVLTLNDDSIFTIEISAWKPEIETGVRVPKTEINAHYFQGKLFLTSTGDEYTPSKLFSFDFESFDMTECKMAQSLPRQMQNHHTILYNGKIYLLGNRYDEGIEEKLSEFYELDLSAKSIAWKKVDCTDSLPKPRQGGCMVEDNGKIYLFGGSADGGSTDNFFDLLEYDIASKTWREIKIQNNLSINHWKISGAFYNGTLFLAAKFYLDKCYGTAKLKVFDQEELVALENEKLYKLQMQNLKVDSESFDINFKVQDQHYSGHKAVLSARCNFFKNMFESGMAESENSEITIQDVEPSTFEAMLDFIYSNKVKFTQNLASNLLKLSDKWSFTPLKNMCEAFLSQQLTQETLKDIAAITKQVEALNLENVIINFVIKKFKATKEMGDLRGLPKELYIKIIAKVLK